MSSEHWEGFLRISRIVLQGPFMVVVCQQVSLTLWMIYEQIGLGKVGVTKQAIQSPCLVSHHLASHTNIEIGVSFIGENGTLLASFEHQ